MTIEKIFKTLDEVASLLTMHTKDTLYINAIDDYLNAVKDIIILEEKINGE